MEEASEDGQATPWEAHVDEAVGTKFLTMRVSSFAGESLVLAKPSGDRGPTGFFYSDLGGGPELELPI